MAPPFPAKYLVVESCDQAQAARAGDSDDVLPFLIPLERLGGEARNPAGDPAVFVDFPHIENILYLIWYVKNFLYNSPQTEC